MNTANAQGRLFISKKIARETVDLFDGVFIDDFWDKFVRKFVIADTSYDLWLGQQPVEF